MSRRGAADPCEVIRPLLSRYCEREVAPWDAMRVARHVPDCTACRIVLSRERCLGRLLDEDLADLPVGDDLVDRVMARLAEEPPPLPRRRLRALELAVFAGLAGLLGGTGWAIHAGASAPASATLASIPSFFGGVLSGLSGALRFAPRAVDGLALGFSLPGGSLAGALGTAATLVVGSLALAACLGVTAIVAGHAVTRRLL